MAAHGLETAGRQRRQMVAAGLSTSGQRSEQRFVRRRGQRESRSKRGFIGVFPVERETPIRGDGIFGKKLQLGPVVGNRGCDPCTAHSRMRAMPDTARSPFQTTQWTLVLATRGGAGNPVAQAALEQLCALYRPPLVAFAMRKGYRLIDAEDLTQGFFVQILTKELFAAADPARGRLRDFLLIKFKGHISDVLAYHEAIKRGGGMNFVPLDAAVDEGLNHRDGGSPTPEECYNREWARASLEAAFERLRGVYGAKGRAGWFAEFVPFLRMGSADEPPYIQVSLRLKTTVGAVKKAVERLRVELTRHLREQVAETLENPTQSQIDEEVAALGAALL